MPTYLITAPDGRKFRVTGEGSKEQALAHFQSQYTPRQSGGLDPSEYDPSSPEYQAKYGPTSAMSGMDKFLAGTGKAFMDVGRGLGQLNDTLGAWRLPAGARELQLAGRAQQEAQIGQQDAPLMQTGAAKAGNFTGNLALAAPSALIPGANTYTGAALGGSIMGALQPTETVGEGARNAAIGGGLGLGGQYLGNKLASWAGSRLAQRSARAATQEAQNTVRDQTLREALEAGYTVPPATTNANWKNTVAESIAGKAATQSLASAKNQQVTNRLIRADLGLADDIPLTRETLKAVRTEAGKAYQAIEQVGDIVADQQYLDDIVDLVGGNTDIAKSFPGARVSADKEVIDLADTLLQEKFTAKAALEYAKRLRSQSKTNFKSAYAQGGAPEKLELARAQWNAAGALEDAIARNLQSQGLGDLAQAFDQARVLIAKSHSAEAALNEGTGNIIASKLVGQLRKGKPMTGGFEKVAKFASLAPKATAEPTQSGGVSALSTFLAVGGALGLGQPWLLALPVARVLTKHALLSKTLQRSMAVPSYAPSRAGTTALQAARGVGLGAAPLGVSAYATEQ